jgi:hypothetical protein
MIDWLKRKMALLALATAKVENSTLNDLGEESNNNISMNQRINQGNLMDSLINGEVTQEVENLRWRMYKINEAAKKLSYNIETDTITKTTPVNLSKIDRDNYDLPLEFIKLNDKDVVSISDMLEQLNVSKDNVEVDKFDYDLSKSSDDGNILIEYNFTPKFKLVDYFTRVNVLTINDEEKLLEFYVSKYPDPHNKKSSLLISELKRVIKNPQFSKFLEFKSMSFITMEDVGVSDYKLFTYENAKFDKIVEYNGSYVIKLKVNVVTNGEYLLEKYVVESLEKAYDEKQKK